MDIATVTKDGTLALPETYADMMKERTEFIVSRSGDTLLLKRVREPVWAVAERTPDSDAPSTEEVCATVREVRKEIDSERREG